MSFATTSLCGPDQGSKTADKPVSVASEAGLKLKPCLFCGSEAELGVRDFGEFRTFLIGCQDCTGLWKALSATTASSASPMRLRRPTPGIAPRAVDESGL